MKKLTGVDFGTGASAKDWAEENEEKIDEGKKALTEKAEKQKLEAQALE